MLTINDEKIAQINARVRELIDRASNHFKKNIPIRSDHGTL
jgi:hypothetical protein